MGTLPVVRTTRTTDALCRQLEDFKLGKLRTGGVLSFVWMARMGAAISGVKTMH